MIRILAKVTMWLAITVVILVSGGHTIYYLMNWEWSRAHIAGTAFVASLVVGSTMLVVGRLQRIEARLEQLAEVRGAETSSRQFLLVQGPLASRRPEPVEPRPDFPWLVGPRSSQALVPAAALAAGDMPELGVFIPVFLAAGLVISVLAGAVERLAALVHGRRSAGTPPTPEVSLRQLTRARPLRMLVAVPLLGLVLSGALVGGLYWASHYWSSPVGAGITSLTVEVDRKGGPVTDEIEIVETVGRYCTANMEKRVRFDGVRPGPGTSTVLRLAPLLDADARARYIGCLEDAVLEWHRLTVTETALTPR